MRYILALSFILTSFNGYCAAAAGAGRVEPDAAPSVTFTSAAFVPDERHTVVPTPVRQLMKDTMHAVRTGLGRSAIYSHILPDFMAAAGTGGCVLDLGCGRAGHITPILNGRKAPMDYRAIDLDATEAMETFMAHIPAKIVDQDGSKLSFISVREDVAPAEETIGILTPRKDSKKEDTTTIHTASVKGNLIGYLAALPENSVDSIFAGHLIHFLDPLQLVSFYKEVRRILKPGHSLYITWADYNAGKSPHHVATYETQLSKLWPGLNIKGTATQALIRENICKAFASAELEAEILKIVRENLQARSPYKPEEVTKAFLDVLHERKVFTNILKPLEMKPLLEDLGFTVTKGSNLHYVDMDSTKHVNSYYGVIAQKTSGAAKEETIPARLEEARKTMDLTRACAIVAANKKLDVLQKFVLQQMRDFT